MELGNSLLSEVEVGSITRRIMGGNELNTDELNRVRNRTERNDIQHYSASNF